VLLVARYPQTKKSYNRRGSDSNFGISLNYDPQRDKRFSGTFKLPEVPRPNLKICVIGNAVHCEEAERIGVDKMSVGDLKKFNCRILLGVFYIRVITYR
jgi:ribosomal protein L1